MSRMASVYQLPGYMVTFSYVSGGPHVSHTRWIPYERSQMWAIVRTLQTFLRLQPQRTQERQNRYTDIAAGPGILIYRDRVHGT